MMNGGYSADAGTLRYPTCSLHTTRVFGMGSGHPGLLRPTLAYSDSCAKHEVQRMQFKLAGLSEF